MSRSVRRSGMRAVACGVVLGFILSGCGADASGPGPGPRTGPREIAFVRQNGTVEFDLALVNEDGSNLRTLTRGLVVHALDWAPDGSRLVFSASTYAPSTGFSPASLYVVQADGAGLRRLSDRTDVSDLQPAWSPDGRTIVFSRAVLSELGADLYSQQVSDGQTTRLTRESLEKIERGNGTSVGLAREPAWSRDGRSIAYVRDSPDRRLDLVVIDAAGGNARTVPMPSFAPDTVTFIASPTWGPDARTLAVVLRLFGNTTPRTYILDATTGVGRPLTSENGGRSSTPSWSGDGEWIAFMATDTRSNPPLSQIFRIRADGTGLTQVTTGAVQHRPTLEAVTVERPHSGGGTR